MTSRWRAGSRSERGAVAIVVALVAVSLFGVAGLAVDLGNAWARKRAVQRQVDVSALGAGWMLPMTATNKASIAEEVATYLNDADNHAIGQSNVTGPQLINDDPADGEVYFQHDDGTPCSDKCTQMRVLAPQAEVDFGFAAAIGFDKVEVQRSATVRVVSELPPRQKSIPFWLPTGCGYGPTQADTTQGGTQPSPTPTATPTATPTGTPTSEPRYEPSGGDVGPHSLSGTAVTEVGYMGVSWINGYSVGGLGGGVKKVTLRAYPPTGTAYVDFAAQTVDNASDGSLPSFQVSSADVTKVPGDWWVWVIAEKNNSMTYSSNHLVIRVTGGPGPTATDTPTPTAEPGGVPVGCVGQDRGNFGQLDSARKEGGAKQTRFARNLALGIDHTLVPYVFAEGMHEQKQCDDPGSPLPYAQLDDVSRNGNNCIVGDTGNDGPKTYDGLVAGLGTGRRVGST